MRACIVFLLRCRYSTANKGPMPLVIYSPPSAPLYFSITLLLLWLFVVLLLLLSSIIIVIIMPGTMCDWSFCNIGQQEKEAHNFSFDQPLERQGGDEEGRRKEGGMRMRSETGLPTLSSPSLNFFSKIFLGAATLFFSTFPSCNSIFFFIFIFFHLFF
jgi:hypothetical protein